MLLIVYSNKLQLPNACIIQSYGSFSTLMFRNQSVLLQNVIDSMKTIKPSYFIAILKGSVGIKYILKLDNNN